ncbi:DUF3127 domain-containing protein [Marinicellulosiphila megalodicopiae]|uniref:DUF3127 domain-containing protein n=1 Tax=Marinicellulosiphila megalodicopiae TaxID=2724896 RepID=UPI003BAE594F
MSASLEITGEIHSMGETTQYGQNGFTKREFVIKVTGEGVNPDYPNYVALELIKDKCALLDQYSVGTEIKAHFNLSGRLWQPAGKPEKCFTSLQAWKIESIGAAQPFTQPLAQAATAPQAATTFDNFDQTNSAFDDDIPF